jgi:membrane protease YdiL (CAAX protease family)
MMIKHSAGEMQQHSTLQSIVLHLLPGAIATAVYILILVWWKRNIYIGIIAHCLLNLIGTTVLFAQLLVQ